MTDKQFKSGSTFSTADENINLMGVKTPSGTVVPLLADANGNLTAVSTPSSAQVVGANNSLAFGSVSTSYANALTLATAAKLISIINNLDVDIAISADGTNAFALVPKNAAAMIDLGALGLYTATNVRVKSLSGSPSSGSVYVAVGK